MSRLLPSPLPVPMSMNVRRQWFLQKWQRVSSPTVVRYWMFRTASSPMNVVFLPCCHSVMASNAQPIAPASPACLWTMISGVLPDPSKPLLDEIHLGFHGREIVLRSALENEAGAQFRQVGNLGDIQPDIFGQHGREAGEDFIRLPSLALEAGDIGLQKHRAAVRENGHFAGGECDVGKLFHSESESLGNGLQEVAVAGRALRVEFEILDPAVFQDDQLDVLSAHIDDGVRSVVIMQGGFRMGNGFDQRNIRADDIPQRVFRVSGCRGSQHFDRGALRFNLAAQLLEDFDGVFDRIALGELVGPGENLALQ